MLQRCPKRGNPRKEKEMPQKRVNKKAAKTLAERKSLAAIKPLSKWVSSATISTKGYPS
jgi:hypothetical protein